MVNDVPTCKCQSLYEGDRCQHYRCSQYCKNKGLCFVDLLAAHPGDSSPPLKVTTTANTLCIATVKQRAKLFINFIVYWIDHLGIVIV
jgi:hypothetical protein